MATKMVIQQPRPLVVAAASDQWSTSICECDSVNECCFSVFCSPALPASLPETTESVFASPYWTVVEYSPITLSMRVSTRRRYGITDSICNDCVYAYFCGPCSWCQIRPENKARLHPVTLINNRAN